MYSATNSLRKDNNTTSAPQLSVLRCVPAKFPKLSGQMLSFRDAYYYGEVR